MIIYDESEKELVIPSGLGNYTTTTSAYQKGYEDGYRKGYEDGKASSGGNDND